MANEERKDNIKFSIFAIIVLLFLPITAPIMWVIDKIHFRENVEFIDVVCAFCAYMFLCLVWGGGFLFGMKIVEIFEIYMTAPLTALMVVSSIFAVVGAPYLFYLGINWIINYKNKKS